MFRAFSVVLVSSVVLASGCRQPINKPVNEANAEPPKPVQGGSMPEGASGKTRPRAFHEERLKLYKLGDYPICCREDYRALDGVWVPESNDPAKALVFPEQVSITCQRADNQCVELTVPLGALGGMVEIMDIQRTDWQVTSWDERGLLATLSPVHFATAPASDRCHSRVLTMTFGSGVASTSDIPTHEKGCEEFTETNSYRLVRGNYYVDTTPKNDMDKR